MKYVTLNGLTKALAGTKSYIDSKISLAEKITYIDLFLLKEQSKLSPGKLYRIIDYQTTTIQENTQAAGHQFDVVVLALTENTLSEEAWACESGLDAYFKNSNLSAWKIWYSLENDTNRFAWAKPNNLMWGVERTKIFKWAEMHAPAGEEDMIFTRYPEGDTVFTSGNYSNMSAYAVKGVLGDKTIILYAEAPIWDDTTRRNLWNLDSTNTGIVGAIEAHYIEESYAPEGQEEMTFKRHPYADTWVQEGQYSGSQLYAFIDASITSGSDGVIIYTMNLNYNSGYDVCDIMGNFIGRITYGDSTGVIYRMIDEYNNDCPYDFKNIQFSRKLLDGIIDVDEGAETYVYTFSWVDLEGEFGDPNFIYDFSIKGNNGDLRTDENVIDGCYDNIIECCIANCVDIIPTTGILYKLNDNVFISHEISNDQWGTYSNKLLTNCYSNSFGNNCCSNIFGSDCDDNSLDEECSYNIFGSCCRSNSLYYACNFNTFGDGCTFNTLHNRVKYVSLGKDCNHNSFGDDCYNNTFRNSCHDNTFGNSCYNNTFRNSCYDNTFGNSCYDNTFGDDCYNNTFRNSCYNNTFRNSCYDNTFGHYCNSNTFGDRCHDNTFGTSCNINSFGNVCSINSFGDYCNDNTFGPHCYDNTFGPSCNINSFGSNNSQCEFGSSTKCIKIENNCNNITFGNANNTKSYINNVTIKSNNQYIYLTTDSTTSSSNNLQNIVINKGIHNNTYYKTINVNTVGQSYQIDIAKDSSGNIRQYCAADLIN